MALGKFCNTAIFIASHDHRQVNIFRGLPTECGIEHIVFGRGRQILTAAYHVSDVHGMIIDHIGEIICGHTVAFEQDLIVKDLVFDGDLAENAVGISADAIAVDFLTDGTRFTCSGACFCGSGIQIAAVTFVFGIFGNLLTVGIVFRFIAETVICRAGFHQLLGVAAIHIFPFALDVGSVRAAHIGTFIVIQSGGFHGTVDHIHSTFHIAVPVGIFDPQNEFSVLRLGDQVRIKRSTQIPHVHKTGGTGCKTGTDGISCHGLDLSVVFLSLQTL